MTRMLVVAASKHGSTTEIAEAVGDELRRRGVEVTVAEAAHAPTVLDFDGYVIGSAVYAGHWVGEVSHFVEEHHHLLAARPVWLFSSGPVGEIASGDDRTPEAKAFGDSLAARGHHVFAGKLERDDLSLLERAAVRFVHAPYGDFRNWTEVEHWADEIAAAVISA